VGVPAGRHGTSELLADLIRELDRIGVGRRGGQAGELLAGERRQGPRVRRWLHLERRVSFGVRGRSEASRARRAGGVAPLGHDQSDT
jgi:hypothetical protein